MTAIKGRDMVCGRDRLTNKQTDKKTILSVPFFSFRNRRNGILETPKITELMTNYINAQLK